jgi:hypothetical protein
VQRHAAVQAEASSQEADELRERLRKQQVLHVQQMGAAVREVQVMHPSTVSEEAEHIITPVMRSCCTYQQTLV